MRKGEKERERKRECKREREEERKLRVSEFFTFLAFASKLIISNFLHAMIHFFLFTA